MAPLDWGSLAMLVFILGVALLAPTGSADSRLDDARTRALEAGLGFA